MFRDILRINALCSLLSLSACGGGSAFGVAQPMSPANENGAPIILGSDDVRPMCGPTGQHRCLGYSLTPIGLKRIQNASGRQRGYAGGSALRKFGLAPTSDFLPPGYGPSDLLQAYGISPSANGGGRLVALVESGDAPTLESDLAVYRTQYGLPACTIASGCLSKIGQNGGPNLPPYDPNWGGETQLDVDMISALCPSCRILVVEASNEGQGMDAAENTAAAAGAFAISNSWGGSENASEAPYFYHPGIIVTAASGDGGYAGGAQSPSDFVGVVAVGGTTLEPAENARGWNETVWTGTGGGCSKIIAKPSWQKDAACSMRTISDIAFDADPASGVAMYDGNAKDSPSGSVGWRVAGGTSVGAPAIAALFTLANISASNASQLYTNATALNDVINGSNGTCRVLSLCNGEVGYDAPSGNGTPNGLNSL